MKLFLRDDEEKILEVRKTPLVLVGPAILVFVLIAAPLFLLVPLLSIKILGKVVIILSYLAAVLYGLSSYLRWRGTKLVITNQRVFDFERRSFFDQTVSEANYKDLREIYYRIQGPINTLFRLGTLTLETPSSHNLELSRILHPEKTAEIIMKRRETDQNQAGDNFSKIVDEFKRLTSVEKRALLFELKRQIQQDQSAFSKDDIYES